MTPSPAARRCAWILLPWLWLGPSSGPDPANAQTLAGLKAAYVYNMLKFTRWPASSLPDEAGQVQLCLYGGGSVITELEKLATLPLGKRQIRIAHPQNEAGFAACHALYISSEERRRYRYLLSLVERRPVLTISDHEQFLRAGGLTNLSEHEQRLRFEVNMAQLSRTRIQLSSKLLQLAIRIDNPG